MPTLESEEGGGIGLGWGLGCRLDGGGGWRRENAVEGGGATVYGGYGAGRRRRETGLVGDERG